ncbi:aldo/keto reductase [Natronolimnobius sp. AArcel1]|uniref:aldo/keto reductase n=1 Tax=Natronolimnobius sp. AArcel1 TaxID=1679093 RepID=UPI0013EE3502|nr:aldo/keto reductase [Natronolimnobius sp. AArcel1]NGM69544.1 aldo/keto reductase [Natronolimnobius sp. AArcel1]
MTVPTKTLPSGDELPMIGFGTWELEGETVQKSVQAALETGYTHIDTAEGYMNEAEIGETLADADVDRDDLFLTSKVLAKNLHYDDVIASCRDSLEKLGTDYLDLYLIHWPNPAISVRETMHAMETLHEEGLVRNVGVSNFSAYQLSAAQHVSDVPIAVNQIEFHPWFQRPDLVEYCEDTDTVLEAAAPLGRTEVFEDEVVQELADEYEKSPAQIVLRWAIERDVVVLPRSTTPEHIADNYALFDWELSSEDRQRLDERDRNEPVYDTPARDWESDVWGIPQ